MYVLLDQTGRHWHWSVFFWRSGNWSVWQDTVDINPLERTTWTYSLTPIPIVASRKMIWTWFHPILMNLDLFLFRKVNLHCSHIRLIAGENPIRAMPRFRKFPVEKRSKSNLPLYTSVHGGYSRQLLVDNVHISSSEPLVEQVLSSSIEFSRWSKIHSKQQEGTPVDSCGVFLYAHKTPGKYLSHWQPKRAACLRSIALRVWLKRSAVPSHSGWHSCVQLGSAQHLAHIHHEAWE